MEEVGWFYDGEPKHSIYYSGGPEWLNQFCGGNGAYWGLVDEKLRHGFENRDYETCVETITALIDNIQMSEEDKKTVLEFFDSKWELYGNSTPQLMFIPINMIHNSQEEYYSSEYFNVDRLLIDVVKGKVSEDLNACSKATILPEELCYFDMSELLPRFKTERNIEQKKSIEECVKMLKGFTVDDLKKAQKLIESIEKGEVADIVKEDSQDKYEDEEKLEGETNQETEMPTRVCVIKKIDDKENNLCIIPGTILTLDDFDWKYFKNKYKDNIQEITMTRDDWIELATNEALECAQKISMLEKASGKKMESYYKGIIPAEGKKVDGVGYGGGLSDAYNKVRMLKMDVSNFEKRILKEKNRENEEEKELC